MPEESALSAIGTARNGGGPEGGDTSTTASVTPTEEGAIASVIEPTPDGGLVCASPRSTIGERR